MNASLPRGARVVYWPFPEPIPLLDGEAASHRGRLMRYDADGRALVKWDNGLTETVEADDLQPEPRPQDAGAA